MIKDLSAQDFTFNLLVAGIGIENENKQNERAMRKSKQGRRG